MRIEVRSSVANTLEKLSESQQTEVLTALAAIPDAFGRPHLHSGLGIRQLRSGVYEARIGLGLRAVFTREASVLRIQIVGNHDDVRHYLKARA